MNRIEKIYIKFVVPVWTAILLFFSILWTLSAVADHDIPMAWALALLYLSIIGFITSDILLRFEKRSGEILNIITLFVSMCLTGSVFGIKAYHLFLIDMASALSAGFCSILAVFIHGAILLYCIHFRRGRAMMEESI